MKATGIVRRIDDLGRVVIPKEIRRTMRIREGDPLEIYTDRDGEVIFKKYSPIGELSDFASKYADTLHKTGEIDVVICDRDAVIAVAGVPRKEYVDRRLSPQLDQIIANRQLYVRHGGEEPISVVVDGGRQVACAMPILSDGDILGCVVSLVSERPSSGAQSQSSAFTDSEVKLVQTAAAFLGRQLET